jgi:hypothetical protein
MLDSKQTPSGGARFRCPSVHGHRPNKRIQTATGRLYTDGYRPPVYRRLQTACIQTATDRLYTDGYRPPVYRRLQTVCIQTATDRLYTDGYRPSVYRRLQTVCIRNMPNAIRRRAIFHCPEHTVDTVITRGPAGVLRLRPARRRRPLPTRILARLQVSPAGRPARCAGFCTVDIVQGFVPLMWCMVLYRE